MFASNRWVAFNRVQNGAGGSVSWVLDSAFSEIGTGGGDLGAPIFDSRALAAPIFAPVDRKPAPAEPSFRLLRSSDALPPHLSGLEQESLGFLVTPLPTKEKKESSPLLLLAPAVPLKRRVGAGGKWHTATKLSGKTGGTTCKLAGLPNSLLGLIRCSVRNAEEAARLDPAAAKLVQHEESLPSPGSAEPLSWYARQVVTVERSGGAFFQSQTSDNEQYVINQGDEHVGAYPLRLAVLKLQKGPEDAELDKTSPPLASKLDARSLRLAGSTLTARLWLLYLTLADYWQNFTVNRRTLPKAFDLLRPLFHEWGGISKGTNIAPASLLPGAGAGRKAEDPHTYCAKEKQTAGCFVLWVIKYIVWDLFDGSKELEYFGRDTSDPVALTASLGLYYLLARELARPEHPEAKPIQNFVRQFFEDGSFEKFEKGYLKKVLDSLNEDRYNRRVDLDNPVALAFLGDGADPAVADGVLPGQGATAERAEEEWVRTVVVENRPEHEVDDVVTMHLLRRELRKGWAKMRQYVGAGTPRDKLTLQTASTSSDLDSQGFTIPKPHLGPSFEVLTDLAKLSSAAGREREVDIQVGGILNTSC